VRERDHSRHLVVGAGAPSEPDVCDGSPVAADAAAPGETAAGPDPAGHPDPPFDAGPFADPPAPRDDVVQAVADFIDDLVDDPTFGDDPHHTRCTSGAHDLDLELDRDLDLDLDLDGDLDDA
jgi:hypothetical protein